MAVLKKLIEIQKELKAPKGQTNTYGGYKYRSCEDILEAVKPLLEKKGCALVLRDEITQVGDRYYIVAKAVLTDAQDGSSVENTAYAREEESKKGMDGAQITGTASSYARKYCLNGLFLIDDTKDADTDEHRKETDAKAKKGKATEEQVRQIKEIAAKQEFAISDDEIRSWTEAYAAKVINQYTGGNR